MFALHPGLLWNAPQGCVPTQINTQNGHHFTIELSSKVTRGDSTANPIHPQVQTQYPDRTQVRLNIVKSLPSTEVH